MFLFISILVWLFVDLGLDQFRGKFLFLFLMVIRIGDFLFGFERWG